MDQIRHKVAIVGAAETDDLGTMPHMSRLALHAQSARNALDDAGLKLSDVDGLLCAGAIPMKSPNISAFSRATSTAPPSAAAPS